MAIKEVKKRWNPYTNECEREFILDAEADVAALPACCTGSSATVVKTGNIYMVNASGEWAIFGGEA